MDERGREESEGIKNGKRQIGRETSRILLGNAREVILNGKEIVVKWSGNGREMLGEWSDIAEKWFEMVVELPWHGQEIVWFGRWS